MAGAIDVFVYGTLRRGELRAGVMEGGGEFLGPAVASGFALYDLGSFPAMVATDEAAAVHGELWQVTPGTLEQLDRIEGHPSFYCRVEINVETRDGRRLAWAYLLPAREVAGCPRIPGGDWVKHRAERAIA